MTTLLSDGYTDSPLVEEMVHNGQSCDNFSRPQKVGFSIIQQSDRYVLPESTRPCSQLG